MTSRGWVPTSACWRWTRARWRCSSPELTAGCAPVRTARSALALAATRAFLAVREEQGGTAWRIADLTDGRARDRRPARRAARGAAAGPAGAGAPVRPGVVLQADGRTALVAVVPLGRLTADQAELLAETSAGDLQLTPWRSVVVPDLADAGGAAAC